MIQVWLIVGAVLGSTPEDCLELYGALRYRDAVVACQSAIAAAERERLAFLYRALGMSFSALGEEESAKAAFISLLALDPDAQLPSSASPKVRLPFEEARKAGAGRPIRLTAEPKPPLRVGRNSVLRVSTQDGPAKPVTTLVVSANGSEQTVKREGEGVELPLDVPRRTKPLAVSIAALDRFDGHLARTSLEFEVAPRPFWLSWKVWGVATAVSAAAGVVAGIYSKRAGEEAQGLQFADDAASRAAAGRTAAHVANTGFAVAGALAIGTVILFATDPAR